MTLAMAIIVWFVWRSRERYALKAAARSAAVRSAAALVATPYAFAYDLAAIAVPVAFLAKDQIACGLLRGGGPPSVSRRGKAAGPCPAAQNPAIPSPPPTNWQD
jgi:hypothetical protein